MIAAGSDFSGWLSKLCYISPIPFSIAATDSYDPEAFKSTRVYNNGKYRLIPKASIVNVKQLLMVEPVSQAACKTGKQEEAEL